MDVSFLDSRVARDTAEPCRLAGSPPLDARPDESFADHLQSESPAATEESPEGATSSTAASLGSDESSSPDQDPPPDQDDETLASRDAAAAAPQPASATEQKHSSSSDQPPQEENRAPTSPAEVPEAATSGIAEQKPDRSAAHTAADPAVPQRRETSPAQHIANTGPESPPVQLQATPTTITPTTITQVEAGLAAEPDASPLPADSDQAAAAATTRSAEKNGAKSRLEKAGTKSRSASAHGQSEELPTGSAAKSDAVGRALEELKQTRASVETLTAEQASASERAAPPPAAPGQDVQARADANSRVHSLTERLPDQLFGRSSASPHASPELAQPDQLRLLQRVARAIEAAPQRGGFLRLRLRPPELGAMRLEVSWQGGHLTARIETETQQAQRVVGTSPATARAVGRAGDSGREVRRRRVVAGLQ